ncbi:unnamed protein product, partial [marine sediment metagenome]
IYASMDFPDVFEGTIKAGMKVSKQTAEISAQSQAEAFLFFENSSTTLMSPDIYEKYVMPEIEDWCDIVHTYDKPLIQHACGHLKDLLPLMAKTSIDAIESITPPPTGNTELWDAADILPERICLIGGIDCTVFLDSNLTELEEYVCNLTEKMKGKHFILANSDSCPPNVELKKFKMIGDFVQGRL